MEEEGRQRTETGRDMMEGKEGREGNEMGWGRASGFVHGKNFPATPLPKHNPQ